jgi:lysophospholipase L1-like esterase
VNAPRRTGLPIVFLVRLLMATVLFGITAEMVARFVFGLGDPPIAVLDEKIEYYLKPSQRYARFGNSIAINHFGMRGEDFPAQKAQSDELRILILGDSVVYGGHKIDQPELMTSLLAELLEAKSERPVTVANIASSSWGPPNMRAYLERFGTFDGDVAILVLSSHDIVDAPRFDQASIPYWVTPPRCALHDALHGVHGRLFSPGGAHAVEGADQSSKADTRETVLEATRQIFALLADRDIPLYIALHLERAETKGCPRAGHTAFTELAKAHGIPVIELETAWKKALQDGEDPYLDEIHLSPAGMNIMAHVFSETLLEWERKRAAPN